MLGLHGWMTLGVLALLLFGLIRDKPADVLFLGAIVLLAALGVITPKEAFAGFSNEGMLTVAALFVVAAGLRETGVMDYVADRLLGRVQTELGALVALSLLLIPLSALLNNTPIVAIMTPVVITWCRRRQISPSRLLIPVSFLTIFGGSCTLIGTSTNLVMQGLMLQEQLAPMTLLELSWVGVPCAIVGVIYMLTIGRRLLPDRKDLIEQLEETRREYLVEMEVKPGCRLIGKAVGEAGLRHLPGLFLIEIDRDGTQIGPVEPDEVIQANDRFVFTGVVSTIVDLEKIPGLVPAVDAKYEIDPAKRRGRQLCEAVISPTSPLVGQTVREADFRALYNAAVVAVHRNGSRVSNKVGDIELRPGDTLLLQTGQDFARSYRNNPDFYLVSDVPGSRPLRQDKAWIAVLLFVALVTGMILDDKRIVVYAFLAGGLMALFRCISIQDARRSVDWTVLIAIAASFGVGRALENSGVAEAFAGILVEATQPLGSMATLAAIYLGVLVITEIISNNAAVVLAFPFCLATAAKLGVSDRPFLIAVTLAASQAFASPIGYQTHMMVFGPGGYRFKDFLRVGIPLNLVLWVVAVLIIPLVWRF